MAQAHDRTVKGVGGDLELTRQALADNHQRVIPSSDEALRNLAEDGLAIVHDLAGLTMHDYRRANHATAKGVADGLVAQAHAQDGNLAGKAADQLDADPSSLRHAWSGGDDDALWLERGNFIQRDLVVALHFKGAAQLAQRLRKVVGKRVLVVNQQYHRISEKYTSTRSSLSAPAILPSLT